MLVRTAWSAAFNLVVLTLVPIAFTLRWTPEQMSRGLERKARAMRLPPVDTEGSSLFTAIREQLGLKLDSQKGPGDVLVVDRAERPKEN